VIRSTKRRKTAQARMVDGRLEVRIPARSSKAEERRLVEQFRRRFERSEAAGPIDVAARARRLARAHDLPRPSDVRWVSNQARQWGSCTPQTGAIRLSDRMSGFPLWVIDHVIVHELAHLVERRHNAHFYELVARYPLAERAEGYLIAKADGTDAGADPLADDEPEPRDDPAPVPDQRAVPEPEGRPAADADEPGRLPFPS